MDIKNYRGVKKAHIVGVLEGRGIEESPYKIVEYILLERNDGKLVTYGKVESLSEEEKSFIGSDNT